MEHFPVLTSFFISSRSTPNQKHHIKFQNLYNKNKNQPHKFMSKLLTLIVNQLLILQKTSDDSFKEHEETQLKKLLSLSSPQPKHITCENCKELNNYSI